MRNDSVESAVRGTTQEITELLTEIYKGIKAKDDVCDELGDVIYGAMCYKVAQKEEQDQEKAELFWEDLLLPPLSSLE